MLPAHVLTNGRGFLRHGGTPQRTFTSPLHPVTGLPLSRLLGGFFFAFFGNKGYISSYKFNVIDICLVRLGCLIPGMGD